MSTNTISHINMKQLFLNIVLLFLFSLTTYAQNFDFEEWIYDSSVGDTVPKYWSAGTSFDKEKTTDAHSGNYAIRIHSWYEMVVGRLVLGELKSSSNERDIISSGLTISGKPTALKGFYKYINVYSGDSAEVIVILKKWNTTTNKADTIAYGRTLLDSIDVYTSFSVTIQDLVPDVQPDSIIIGIYSTAYSINCGFCDYLYIDSLSLEGGSIVLESNNIDKKKVGVNIYPNPFSESTRVEIINWESINKNLSFTLYNVLGENIRTIPIKSTTFKIQKENLKSGVYFYQINNDSQTIANGKLVVN